jgi:hypothetical protein
VSDLAELNGLTKQIIGAAIEAHRHFGAGINGISLRVTLFSLCNSVQERKA